MNFEQIVAIEEAQRRGAERILKTPDGKALLDLLERSVGADLMVGGDPYATHFNLGAYSIVQYLKRLGEPDGRS